VDCVFAGRVENSKFSGRPWGPWAPLLVPPRAKNEFRGNDFRGAGLAYVSFSHGIEIDAQLWPTGPDYARIRDLPRAIERVRRDVATDANEKRRHARLAAFRTMTTTFEDQKDVFVHRSTATTDPSIWALLEAADAG
jgi:hypothetical protein